MGASTLYSAGTAISDTGMGAAVEVLDSFWISLFWAPASIQFDQSFESHDFEQVLLLSCTNLIFITAPLNNKNGIESRHKRIRDIFKSFESNSHKFSEKFGAQQPIHISSDLNGDDVFCPYCMNRKEVLRVILNQII